MTLTDELKILVSAEVGKAVAEMQKFDSSVKKTKDTTGDLGEALKKLNTPMLVMGSAIATAGGAAIKFAGDVEKTKASLTVLLKDGNAATAMFKDWQQLAAETPFSSSDIETAGKQLLAFNIEASKVTPTLRSIGDISAATGSSISEIAEIYGKAAVQGRLFAEDINQFQGRGIPIVQELAKIFGTTEANIKEMVGAGKIGFSDLEKAFTAMTAPGGMFAGMMEKLSETTLGKFSTAMDNGKMALASFGEILLPLANDFLDMATSFFSGITEMDDGTKRFIIAAGGVVAISAPVILAIKGISAAFIAMSANPLVLAISIAIAGSAALAGIIAKQRGEQKDLAEKYGETKKASDDLLRSYANGNKDKKIDEDTTRRLIELYPGLKRELNNYGMSVKDVTEKLEKYNSEKATDSVANQVQQLQKLQDAQKAYYSDLAQAEKEFAELKEYAKEYNMSDAEYKKRVEFIQQAEQLARREYDLTAERFTESLQKSNDIAKLYGLKIQNDLSVITIPITVDTNSFTPEKDSSAVKKKWQQWFEEITDVKQTSFKSGEEAGLLYIVGLESSFKSQENIAEALGEKVDIAEILKKQQGDISKTITDLLQIDTADIDSTFKLQDESIQKLIESYRALGSEIELAQNQSYVIAQIETAEKKVSDFGKTQKQLAIESLKARDATGAQTASLEKFLNQQSKNEILDKYKKQVEELGKSQEELARLSLIAADATEKELAVFDTMVEALQPQKDLATQIAESVEGILLKIPQMSSEAVSALAAVSAQMMLLVPDAAITGFEELGSAFAEGKDASEAMTSALASVAEQILNQLPMLFLNAGLNLITQGQWALGLGLIAAAASTSAIKGYVGGKKNEVKENALGGVYDSIGVSAFAKGGAFTNSIIDTPTFFPFAKGTGLMGEVGPEAIMPLKRGGDGSLGVSLFGSSGGNSDGGKVIITIINNTGDPVEKKEGKDADGNRQVEIIIGSAVSGLIDKGRFDGGFKSRYGLKVQGV